MRRRYATRQRFVEREIPCATPDGLVLLKLYALPSLYRQGDLTRVALYETDILTLMDRCGIDLEPLFAELALHLSPTDLASLRQITDEIRQRIERFGGRRSPDSAPFTLLAVDFTAGTHRPDWTGGLRS